MLNTLNFGHLRIIIKFIKASYGSLNYYYYIIIIIVVVVVVVVIGVVL